MKIKGKLIKVLNMLHIVTSDEYKEHLEKELKGCKCGICGNKFELDFEDIIVNNRIKCGICGNKIAKIELVRLDYNIFNQYILIENFNIEGLETKEYYLRGKGFLESEQLDPYEYLFQENKMEVFYDNFRLMQILKYVLILADYAKMNFKYETGKGITRVEFSYDDVLNNINDYDYILNELKLKIKKHNIEEYLEETHKDIIELFIFLLMLEEKYDIDLYIGISMCLKIKNKKTLKEIYTAYIPIRFTAEKDLYFIKKNVKELLNNKE